jgi:localization factor PodJL
MIAAAVLLVLSALLLYGRLKSKPEPEVTAPPAVEQTVPAPGDQSQETPAPETGGQSQSVPGGGEGTPPPAAGQSQEAPAVEKSGSWDPEVMEEEPAENALGEAEGAPGTTEIAKSPRRAEAGELTPAPELVSLKSNDAPALPPGVVFSIQEPAGGAANPATASAQPGLLLPAETVGPAVLREAAAAGNPAAQYVVALRYLRSDNAAEAVRWLERAASAGLAPAQYRLGAMYERGQGVAKDLGRARSWYQSAAEKGNVKAMHNLAVSASGREGGNPDYAVAAKWYGEAASYGLADSQFNLGILAEHGLGQEQNAVAAYKWFSLAANSGDKEAAKRRAQVKAKLDAASLAAAEEAVKSWHAKAANADANEVATKAEWGDPVAASSGAQKENVALVSRAQALLNKLGYDAGSADGVMGERTRAAIKSFERRSGLLETGDVTIQLVTHLERAAG